MTSPDSGEPVGIFALDRYSSNDLLFAFRKSLLGEAGYKGNTVPIKPVLSRRTVPDLLEELSGRADDLKPYEIYLANQVIRNLVMEIGILKAVDKVSEESKNAVRGFQDRLNQAVAMQRGPRRI